MNVLMIFKDKAWRFVAKPELYYLEGWIFYCKVCEAWGEGSSVGMGSLYSFFCAFVHEEVVKRICYERGDDAPHADLGYLPKAAPTCLGAESLSKVSSVLSVPITTDE